MASVTIIGAGAIGGLTAAHLARAGHDVTVFEGWAANIEAIRTAGLRIKRPDVQFIVEPGLFQIAPLESITERSTPIGFLIIAVKSYDTRSAVDLAKSRLADDSVVISAQNGINEPYLVEAVGAKRTLGTVVYMSGHLEAPGCVRATTRSDGPAFTIGELDGMTSARSAEVADLLSAVGSTATTTDIWGEMWSKLTLNVMLNAVAGITGLPTHDLWSNTDALAVMVHLAGETIEVAQRLGVAISDLQPPGAATPIPCEQILLAHRGDAAALQSVTGAFGSTARKRISQGEQSKPSLLQDMLRRRRTEIDYLNGYVLGKGDVLSIATPANQAVVDLLRTVEIGERAPSPDLLDLLSRKINAASTG